MRTPDLAIAERKKRAVEAFLDQHKLDVAKAAEAAGSNENELRSVFTELCKKPFKHSLEILDVNKPFLAHQCRELLKDKKTKAAEKVHLIKLLLKTLGEEVEESQAPTVNLNTPKALVIVGGNAKRLQAMVAPQLEESHG